MSITVIFETNEYLVINKPAGISVHGDGKVDVYTVADWVLEMYPLVRGVGEDVLYNGRAVLRPGIVHRLDKDTSGALLIAKTQEAYLFFKKQFQEHTIEKVYHCFVYGSIKNDAFSIDAPIGRSTGDVRRWAVGKGTRGTLRDAYTDFKVLARIGVLDDKASTEPGTYSFVECRPKTGRTHQLRVHLRSINHPIVCDSLYAPKREPALGFTRLALHAYSLSFMDIENKQVCVVAPYFDDFTQAVIAIKD